jgi:DNA repair exonuclease SbcCD nuclease subunit
VKILHLADVHLERPFRGLRLEQAKAARLGLWEAFRRCLRMARDREVDLVTLGGDLWEHEHVSKDTVRSVAHELARLGLPVIAVAGNHDPASPGGPYDWVEWPSNVTIVRSSEPREYRLDGVSVWGVSWTGGSLRARFLDTFRAPSDGRAHLLLLHGTCRPPAWLLDEEDACCPFTPDQVRGAGFAACLAGHWHKAAWQDGVCYPGSPEPLGFDEDGPHCVALVEVQDEVTVELVAVAESRFLTVEVDCSGAESGAEVEERVEAELSGLEGQRAYLRLRLAGRVAPGCEVDREAIERSLLPRFAAARVEDRTGVAYDLEALSRLQTVEGAFVRRLRGRLLGSQGREREVVERALELGIASLRGEGLPRVD